MKLTNPFVLLALVAAGIAFIIWLAERQPSTVGPVVAEPSAVAEVPNPAPPQAEVEADLAANVVPTPAAEPPAEPTVEDRVVEMVKGRLKDPFSAHFRDVRQTSDGKYVCGQVNARNAMGGYVGYRQFVAILERDKEPALWIDAASEEIAAVLCSQPG